MIKDYANLIRKLPAFFNFIWLVMHVGVGFLIAGFLQHSVPMGLIGLGLVVFCVVIASLDCVFRKGDREATAVFSMALMLSLICLVGVLAILLALLAIFFIALALFGEFSWQHLLNTLHFFGVAMSFFLVTGIATGAKTMERAEQRAAEERAAGESS